MRTASPPVITRPQQTVMDFSGSGSVSGDRLELARVARNDAWKDNGDIPAWVVPEDVDLDRFFTRRKWRRSAGVPLSMPCGGITR